MTDITKRSQSLFMQKLKIALLIFLPLAVFINSVLWFFFYRELKEEKNILETRTFTIIEMQSAKIASNFDPIVADLLFFAGYNQLMDMLEENSGLSNKRLMDDLALFSRGSKVYDQIRVINAEGMEVIRVNMIDGKPAIVPGDQFQFKGNRYYFKDTVALDKREVFISPFDLNIEQGMIEQPLKPMIRFGTPIFDREGQKRGIIIFNYLGANLIREFKSMITDYPGFNMLINANGYWIIGRDAGDEWGFMYEDRKDLTMGNSFPSSWERISASESGQFHDPEGLFTFTTIYPLLEGWKSSTGAGKAFVPSRKMKGAKEYFWKIVSYVPRKYIIEESMKTFNKYIYISIIISLMLGIGTWFMASARVKHIIDDWNMEKYSEKLEDRVEERIAELAKVNENLKDEIAARRKAENKNKEYAENLEQQVKERTKELEEKTEKLQRSEKALIYLLEDVNEIRNNMKKANIKLKELDQLKSMFIASMSHELRTPLNSIIGFTGIILQEMDGEINPQQKDHLGRANKSAKHLLSLINDVIDISKVEAGKSEVFIEEFMLDGIINEAVGSIQPQVKEKGLSFEVSVPPGVRLNTDRKRVMQCILNYLSNAFKFTEAGTITVIAREIGGEVEVTVSDTGIGISEQDQAELFEAFVRLDSHLSTQTLGTGLGLYLTKKLATELLGGTVAVKSQPGQGSTFTLRLPKEIKHG